MVASKFQGKRSLVVWSPFVHVGPCMSPAHSEQISQLTVIPAGIIGDPEEKQYGKF
jgi:hypothetical protein